MGQYQRIKLTQLEPNRGQIDGLPANPREWTQEELDRLKKSIDETPELLEARGAIVVPHGKKYVILGGNMRYFACKENGATDMPCYVLEDATTDKMKEIVIKDNGSFGRNDWDALGNEWDDLPLGDWGVPAWKAEPIDEGALDGLFEDAGEQGEKGEKITIEVPTDYEDSIEDIKAAIKVTLEEWKGCKVK